MNKSGKRDPLVAEIETKLMPGSFVARDEMLGFTTDLDRVQERLAALVREGDAERAVRPYEILLSGMYAKIEQCDDECYLSMSFADAFCGWIKARQAAGRPADETVNQILQWKKNDNYGFCFEIEKKVVKALDRKGRRLFIGHFQDRVEKAMPNSSAVPTKAIFEYENDLRLPAIALKEIYEALIDAHAYAALCEKLGFSPRDCEHLAAMEMAKKHWTQALEWVERGIKLARSRDWKNEVSYSLERLRPELLRKLGRKEDALASAWADFRDDPNDFSYEALMRYVPKSEKSAWHDRALTAANKANLGAFIALCVKAKEWQRLAGRVRSAEPAELERLSHYCTEPAAKDLAKHEPLAAAKLFRALGLRILNAGKSKYYDAALDHFEKARDLYFGAGRASEWEALVRVVRITHSRKSGFLSAFEQIVSGKPKRSPNFAVQAQERWKRLTS
jgi:tetratricopeptide (TPR) repeat protein